MHFFISQFPKKRKFYIYPEYLSLIQFSLKLEFWEFSYSRLKRFPWSLKRRSTENISFINVLTYIFLSLESNNEAYIPYIQPWCKPDISPTGYQAGYWIIYPAKYPIPDGYPVKQSAGNCMALQIWGFYLSFLADFHWS